MPKESELERVKQLLDTAETNIRAVKNILFAAEVAEKSKDLHQSEGKIIEGVFNGETMIGADKKIFPVPSNYASKSKLVSGDILKLTILDDGTFLFKQIGPVKRKKVVGELLELNDGKYAVSTEDAEYQVLPASITYFKAKAGDKLTILLPEGEVSEWAAVENLLESK